MYSKTKKIEACPPRPCGPITCNVPKVRISSNQPVVKIKIPDCRMNRCKLDCKKLPPYIEESIDWSKYVREMDEKELGSMEWKKLPSAAPVYVDMAPQFGFGTGLAFFVKNDPALGFVYAIRQIDPFRTGKDVETIQFWSVPYAININGHTRQVIHTEKAVVYWIDSTEDTIDFFHTGGELKVVPEESYCEIKDPDQRKAMELLIRDYPMLLNKYGFTYRCGEVGGGKDLSKVERGKVGFGPDTAGDERGATLRKLNRGDPTDTETPQTRGGSPPDLPERDQEESGDIESEINRVKRTGDPISGQKVRGWVPEELADQPNSVFDDKISKWMEVGLDMRELKRLGAGQTSREETLFTKENISSNMNLADIQFRPGAVISRPKGMFAGKEFDF